MKNYGIIGYLINFTKAMPVSFSAVLSGYIITEVLQIIFLLLKTLFDPYYLAGIGAYAFVLVGSPALISTCGQDIFNMNPCDLNI